MRKTCKMKALILAAAISMLAGCGSTAEKSEVSTEAITETKAETAGTAEAENTETAKKENTESEINEADTQKEIKVPEKQADKEYYMEVKLDSQAIAGNLYGNDTERTLVVYLPPSYYNSEANYPVVYYLHGFGDTARGFVKKRVEKFDLAFAESGKEFILVAVDGAPPLGGAYYVNSPVSGNWEDYVIDEVVPYMDDNFRTIADRDSRGMCGFSMGGFSTINLSFKHPDVFAAAFAISPGLLADGELPIAMETWKGDMAFLKAYAQAFSPNPDDKETMGNIPQFDNTPEDDAIVENWESGFGNLEQKVKDYVSLNNPLKAVRIIYGATDLYMWIPTGCEALSNYLTSYGVEHTIDSFNGGHVIPREAVSEEIVPFFNEHLEY